MKKIFTFLVAFLTTVSGAVWGQLGAPDNYYDIAQLQKVLEIEDSEEYYLTGANNYGILVKAGGSSIEIGGDKRNKPHIYLKDVSFGSVNTPMGGSAIIIENRTVVTITIEGENSIVSNGTSDAAIKLETGEGLNTAELIFDGTGLLDINMLGNKAVNQVAIGERGVDGIFGQDALHNCGSLTINGGTITTNGYLGEFDSHAFRMNGNGIVVAQNIETSGNNWQVSNGIYYEKEEDGQNALNVKGNVTISSPIPDENVYVGEGSSLTLGEGDVLDADKVTIAEGGTLNAYKVSYDLNKSVGSKTITVADEAPYGTYYCGNKTALLEGPNATNSEPSWHNLGWANNTSIMTATPASVPGSVTEAANQITAKAIWAVNQWTTVQVTTGEKMTTPIQLVYPDNISAISFEETTTGILDTFGAKLEGSKVLPGDNGAGDANESPENVTLKIKVNEEEVSGKTTTIPFEVNNDAPDLSDIEVAKVTVTEELIYSGTTVDVEKLITSVTVNGKEVGTTPFDVKYSSDENGENIIDAPTNQETYYVFIQAKDGDANYQKASKPQQFKITPKAITTVTAEPEQIDLVIGDEESAFSSVKFSSIDIYEVDKKTVTINATAPTASWEVPGIYSIVYSELSLEGNELGNYTLGEGVTAKGKVRVSISGDDEPINPGIPDEGEEDDDVIIRVKGWEVEDGAYQHVYTGDVFDATSLELEAKQVMEDGSIDWYSIPENAITNIAIESYKVGGSSATATKVKNAGFYLLQITLDANRAEGLLYDGVVSSLPVRITPRDLSINFPLDDITEEQIGKELNPNDLYWEDETKDIEDAGLVYNEGPVFSGYIRIAGTANEDGKYDVYYKLDIEDEGAAGFLKINYNPSVSISDTEITLGEEGEIEGIEVDSDDDDDNTGSGIISTKRYRLYLANQDYLNTGNYKKYYDELGLVLYSRHNQKYTTNTDKSFTIWYEQNGEVNAGNFRVFMSNRANGEYKEVTLDEVSGYYQIRNVTSNVYVKLCWSNGHPVANEDITATDARAYAQPNKIVVITPQPTDVQIISMAGAVVATDKVTGQREFANLAEGVYIVRMGETVVKLQVRK